MCGSCRLRSTKCEYGQDPSTSRKPNAKTNYSSPPESQDGTTTVEARPAPVKGTWQPQADLEKIPFASEATLGLDIFATSIASLTRSHALTKTSSNTLPFLLHHFTSSGFATLSSYTGQKILKDQVPGLATQYPFLLDTILAFSANHVTYLGQRQRPEASKMKQMNFTATWHTLRALRGYGRTLNNYQDELYASRSRGNGKPMPRSQRGLGTRQDRRQEIDALIAACLMLTSLFYHVVETDEQSRVWSSKWVPDETQDVMSATENVNDQIGLRNRNDVMATPFPDHGPPLVSLGRGHSALYGPAAENPSTRHWSRPKCDWVTNMTGLSILLSLKSFQEQLPYSIWSPFFAEAREEGRNGTVGARGSWSKGTGTFDENGHQRDPPNPSNQVESSTEPCDIVNPPLESPEPQRLPHLHTLLSLESQHHVTCAPLVTHLTSLLALSPADLNNFSPIISFPARFSPALPPLISNRHVIALLILGYFFGMLEGVPHWWCYERGRSEGLDIQHWLIDSVRSMSKTAKGWGALRESEAGRRWREGSARAVEEFVQWRKERRLG